MYELVTFCVTVSVIIGATTIGAVAGVLVYTSLHKFDNKPATALHCTRVTRSDGYRTKDA